MKKITPLLPYLKYLFWLGPVLLIAGLTAGLVSGVWNAIPVVLILLGLGLIVAWFTLALRNADSAQAEFLQRRSTQVGANAVVATLSALAIFGLVNFLAARYVGRVDLTENQVFTLAPETQQVVKNLQQPVKAWVFTPNSLANQQDRELLESYRRLGDRFSYEFVDPNSQPTLVQKLEVKSPGDVIVQVQPDGRKQYLQTVSPNDAAQLASQGQRLTEAKLTTAIAQVTSPRQSQVYFLQGHGERALEPGAEDAISEAIGSLKERDIVINPLLLAESLKIPADADVVVLAGPQKPLLAQEVKALDAYLEQGGNLLVMADPQTNPGLDSLLNEWGIRLDDRVVIDVSQQIANLGPIYALVTQYGDHPITKEFGNRYSFYPLARPVDVDPKSGIVSTPLLYTSAESWGETDLKNQPLKFDQGRDRQGPLLLGVALSRPVTAKPQPTPSPSPSPGAASPSPTPSPSPEAKADPKKESRLVVIGNSRFASDGLYSQPQFVNGDLFLNSVRWLSQSDQQVLSISPKTPQNRRFNLSGQQASLAGWTAIALLPLLGFTTAIAVWWKRR
ncbi:MAG TPA: Gldg family protein [Leptolyngbyaceae cyanobacterium M33_DOE_097]|uniref:ABC transporter n=1 Tax=Oscillatoriales cyanobacterium SpSt-418 TaxID=2282169 RepID=A0A7C3KHL9_9CYAN|nr:Gldg family protein [Leptolyngbyaceae cyanobacterium M33_DOE_097]